MKKIQIEPLEIEELNDLKNWLKDEDVYKNLYLLYHPKTTIELEDWYIENKNNGAHIFRYLSEKSETVGIGLAHYIHTKNRCCEISFIVDPEESGKGFGKMILDHLMRYSFHILNLHKIFIHTAEFNKKVFSLAESRGFSIEGTFRKELYYSGKYYDIYRFGLLDEEYEKNLVDLA